MEISFVFKIPCTIQKKEAIISESCHLSESHTAWRCSVGDKRSDSIVSSIKMDWMMAGTKGRIKKPY